MIASKQVMALKTDREKCAHLLRRFGLGASEAELDFYLSGGLAGAIDKLLNYEAIPEEPVSLEAMRPEDRNVPMPLVQAWWILRIASSRRPLQEKMTLFWHDHFATSAQKVTGSMMMYHQNETLRENATGRFQTLLSAVSKDPAMLFWLDNQYNVKGKPNENFAREVMELFTLGIGHYSEKDVQEAARAFTGWTIRRRNLRDIGQVKGKLPSNVIFQFVPNLHDTGVKTILGNTGNFDGDDVLGILCGHPRTAYYITEKVWNFFVYPDPEKTIIERHAKKFRDSGLDIKVLLRSIMEDPLFYSDKAERAIYKCPVDFCVATIRQLGLGESVAGAFRNGDVQAARPRIPPIVAAQQAMKSMGMDLLFPPDVNGWDGGPAWVTSATMVERIQWADRMFPVQLPAAQGGAPRSRKAVFNYPIMTLIADNPVPENLVSTLISVFDAQVPETKRKAMLEAAQRVGSRYTNQTANRAANAVARLIFGSPEFQFA